MLANNYDHAIAAQPSPAQPSLLQLPWRPGIREVHILIDHDVAKARLSLVKDLIVTLTIADRCPC